MTRLLVLLKHDALVWWIFGGMLVWLVNDAIRTGLGGVIWRSASHETKTEVYI